jgi:hypothetical protein
VRDQLVRLHLPDARRPELHRQKGLTTMTPQELRIERRRRAYGSGHRERNSEPKPTERIDQIRRATQIDQEIAAQHPELLGRNGHALELRRRELELLRLAAG